MITYKKGDLFQSEAQTLVATVNCVGIMGKGLAKEFKQRYPKMFKEYAKACKKGELRRGKPFLYSDLNMKILCFPTKDNWKGPSKYEFIEDGLITLHDNYKEWGITSIAIPPLGSGLGGLHWERVRDLINKHLSDLPIDIEVYEPLDNKDRIPRKNPFRNKDKVKLTPASILTGEMIRIARHKFPPEIKIGRLLLQKIAFFSQMAGLPIKLNFQKYKLGPYDYKLKFNVERLEGMFIRDASTTIQRSDLIMLDENEWLKAIENSNLDIDMHDAQKKITKVVDLLKDYSLSEIELLSSVYLAWATVVANGLTGTTTEIINFINEWKVNKFNASSIDKALKILLDKGLIMPTESTMEKSKESEEIVFA
jgi:O-acetyl-ADP-ribose deacetylase (regulator of RNase III)/uncharacterized protein YwgA